jgi:hypothetical protein
MNSSPIQKKVSYLSEIPKNLGTLCQKLEDKRPHIRTKEASSTLSIRSFMSGNGNEDQISILQHYVHDGEEQKMK